MFQKVWELIQNRQLDEAIQILDAQVIEEDYLLHISQILRSEIALQKKEFEKSIDAVNDAFKYFIQLTREIDEFEQDPSGLGLNFLEICYIDWIYARALAGQQRWTESLSWGQNALKEWDCYRIARLPFLHFKELSKQWESLPNRIQNLLDILYKFLKAKPTREELLELIVSDDFDSTAAKLTVKNNDLSAQPTVDVCIATYGDGDWLRITIDSILKNAHYENFSVIIVYQKKHPSDPLDAFLESPFYANHPKLKLFVFDHPLGADNAKQMGYECGTGELIISLDGHIIACHHFIEKTVEVFKNNKEVSLLGYGVVNAYLDHSLHGFFYNEVPHWIDGIMVPSTIVYERPEALIPFQPGLYKRQSIMGAAFCITRKLFKKLGGYLLKDRSWGDKSLAMNAYLYGYYAFAHPDLVCVHKWHSDPALSKNSWKETDRRISALEDMPGSALTVGYFYFSQKYFENYFLPYVQMLCGETFDFHWQHFQEKLPELTQKKKEFWKHAERSLREFWLEFGDYIWSRLSPEERKWISPYETPPKKL